MTDTLAAARTIDAPDLGRIAPSRLEAMREAGLEAIECMRVLTNSGDNIVGELLRDAGTFYEWNHYPDGDVYDPASHAQYYYHAHPQELRSGEHGHFHTFMRGLGMPAGMLPAPVADLELPDALNDALSHLVAVSMDPRGEPIRLFTTNRWVTGETVTARPTRRRCWTGSRSTMPARPGRSIGGSARCCACSARRSAR